MIHNPLLKIRSVIFLIFKFGQSYSSVLSEEDSQHNNDPGSQQSELQLVHGTGRQELVQGKGQGKIPGNEEQPLQTVIIHSKLQENTPVADGQCD